MAVLTQRDVARLLKEHSAAARAETAAKIGAEFSGGKMDSSARKVAEEIFRMMLRDAEMRVRKELSESLKHSPLVPHDVALSLAKDVIDVAEPMLTCSQVLTDEDLIEIVRTEPSSSRVAVARRQTVSSAVSDALVESQDEDAVVTLAGNTGAEFSEVTYERILDTFPESGAVKHNLAHRAHLPIKVAERLVSMVSDRLREHLVTHHDLSVDVAADLILESREKATLGLVSSGTKAADIDDLVAQLHASGRLTPSIVFRALCTGDLVFFESAMARLAGIPVANAHELVHDESRRGLDILYRRAGLPKEMYAAVRVAVNVAREVDYDGGPDDRERYRTRTIERFLTQFEELDSDNLDYLLAKLGRSFNAADAARDDASLTEAAAS